MSSCTVRNCQGIAAVIVCVLSWMTFPTRAVAQRFELGRLPGPEWSTREVHPAVMDAAKNGSAQDLASALARARVPAGAVLSADDMWVFPRPPAEGAGAGPVALGAALNIFLTRQPGRFIREQDAVLLLLPARLPDCTTRLTRRIPALDAEGQAFAVKQELVRAANRDRTPIPPPALIRSGLSSLDMVERPLEDDGIFYRSPVTLHLRDVSVAEALNALVLQVPGLGWALVERYEIVVAGPGPSRDPRTPDRRKLPCTVELVGPNGMTSGSDVLKAPRP